MKAILLPTDFSKISINAIHFAIDMFREESCDFYLLNVQKASSFISDDMMVMSSSTTIYETLVSAAKKSIDNIILKIKTKYGNDKHQFHSIVDYDNLINSINQSSKTHNIDLIVMGTKGSSGLESVLFGSNTAHVMQQCDVPVLAIPSDCKFKGFNKVLFTTNHLSLHGIDELKSLLYLKSLFNFKLEILHIKDELNSTNEVLSNEVLFKKYFSEATSTSIEVSNKKMFEKVNQYIVENKFDLFVMVSTKHSYIDRLLTRYPVETFGLKIHTPLLVMNKV
ncbi:universal stress protein [Flavobacteriaceae bacterium XHP0103]|uniref:universal stress protein n=1 Tax=Marixanthotalea marina TaxID=2844359 RepID=UPI002989DDFA|nr:universal stress protein [Marixanthotalea marina]MBU3821548.1 universal stress protein [Marixanthotalea marina]